MADDEREKQDELCEDQKQILLDFFEELYGFDEQFFEELLAQEEEKQGEKK